MNRTTLSLLGAATALAAVTGAAALTAPTQGGSGGSSQGAAERKPVQRSTLVCPRPSGSQLAETRYTAFVPKNDAEGKGSAALLPAPEKEGASDGGENGKEKNGGEDNGGDGESKGDGDSEGGQNEQAKPVLPLKKPGTPVTHSTDQADAPALVGTADGRFAPGWTVQQTTTVSGGVGRGLHGTACSAPGTDFWFPGASTAKQRRDYIHLTNPEDAAAVVDLRLYGEDGAIRSEAGEGITVPPRSTVPVLLSTLTSKPVTDLSVHVVVRTGRIGAQLHAVDEKGGGDWLPPVAVPRPTVVLPGIPADATSVRLTVHVPGGSDADLRVRLSTPTGTITPAGHETLHVDAGSTTTVDLRNITRGEAGSLILSPTGNTGDTPIVAAAQVVRGKDSEQESGFIPATTPVERRATAAGNRGKNATLSLYAHGSKAKVRVTASTGSDGGSARSRTYTVKAGSTRAIEPPRPKNGEGAYALTVEPLSGGEVYAARTLAVKKDGVPMFTVQTLPDDHGSVIVPDAERDLSVLTR